MGKVVRMPPPGYSISVSTGTTMGDSEIASNSEFERFKKITRDLLKVPKAEVDEARKKA